MKGRESGMPDEEYWGSFFNPRCILERLDCAVMPGDEVEFGCGYGTFTIAAAGMISGRVFALAVSPQPAQTAVRAGIRAVALRGRADRFQMLIEGGDARYNSVHRPVALCRVGVVNPR